MLDIATGKPSTMLVAPKAWYGAWLFGQCTWLDDETVLVQGEPGLLASTPGTGALERVTAGVPYDASLATDALE